MLQPLSVPVQESILVLRVLQKRHPNKYKPEFGIRNNCKEEEKWNDFCLINS